MGVVCLDVKLRFKDNDPVYTNQVCFMHKNRQLTAFILKAINLYCVSDEYRNFFDNNINEELLHIQSLLDQQKAQQQDAYASMSNLTHGLRESLDAINRGELPESNIVNEVTPDMSAEELQNQSVSIGGVAISGDIEQNGAGVNTPVQKGKAQPKYMKGLSVTDTLDNLVQKKIDDRIAEMERANTPNINIDMSGLDDMGASDLDMTGENLKPVKTQLNEILQRVEILEQRMIAQPLQYVMAGQVPVQQYGTGVSGAMSNLVVATGGVSATTSPVVAVSTEQVQPNAPEVNIEDDDDAVDDECMAMLDYL